MILQAPQFRRLLWPLGSGEIRAATKTRPRTHGGDLDQQAPDRNDFRLCRPLGLGLYIERCLWSLSLILEGGTPGNMNGPKQMSQLRIPGVHRTLGKCAKQSLR